MKESLERITFKVTRPEEAAELATFHAEHGNRLPWEASGIVRAPEVADLPEAQLRITESNGKLFLEAFFEDENGEFQEHAKPLAMKSELRDWALAAFNSRLFEFRLDVTYTKPASGPTEWVAYSDEGLRNLTGAIACASTAVRIETPLVEKLYHGQGISIGPIGHPATLNPAAHTFLVVPEIPSLDRWLVSIQAEALRQNGMKISPDATLKLGPLRELALWLADHRFRQGLLQQHARTAGTVGSDAGVALLLNDLKVLELDLTRTSVAALTEAKEALSAAAVEPVKTMQQLRLSLVGTLGGDIFQSAVSMALVLGGFKLANYENTTVMILVLTAVSLLFLAGFSLRATTQEAVFRETMRMQKELLPAPIATVLPGFQKWASSALHEAVTSFYWALAMATPVAFAPIIGVTTFWLASTGVIAHPAWFFLVAEGAAILAAAIAAKTLISRRLPAPSTSGVETTIDASKP